MHAVIESVVRFRICRLAEKRMDNLLFAEVGSQLENLTRRERQNLRQRGGILDAALRLFSEKGYNNVSMHEIAGEAEFGSEHYINSSLIRRTCTKPLSWRWQKRGTVF